MVSSGDSDIDDDESPSRLHSPTPPEPPTAGPRMANPPAAETQGPKMHILYFSDGEEVVQLPSRTAGCLLQPAQRQWYEQGRGAGCSAVYEMASGTGDDTQERYRSYISEEDSDGSPSPQPKSHFRFKSDESPSRQPKSHLRFNSDEETCFTASKPVVHSLEEDESKRAVNLYSFSGNEEELRRQILKTTDLEDNPEDIFTDEDEFTFTAAARGPTDITTTSSERSHPSPRKHPKPAHLVIKLPYLTVSRAIPLKEEEEEEEEEDVGWRQIPFKEEEEEVDFRKFYSTKGFSTDALFTEVIPTTMLSPLALSSDDSHVADSDFAPSSSAGPKEVSHPPAAKSAARGISAADVSPSSTRSEPGLACDDSPRDSKYVPPRSHVPKKVSLPKTIAAAKSTEGQKLEHAKSPSKGEETTLAASDRQGRSRSRTRTGSERTTETCFIESCPSEVLRGTLKRHFHKCHPEIDDEMYKRRRQVHLFGPAAAAAAAGGEDVIPKRRRTKEKTYYCPRYPNCTIPRADATSGCYFGTRHAIDQHVRRCHSNYYTEDEIKAIVPSTLVVRTDTEEACWKLDEIDRDNAHDEMISFEAICNRYYRWRTSIGGGMFLDEHVPDTNRSKQKTIVRAMKEKSMVFRLLRAITTRTSTAMSRMGLAKLSDVDLVVNTLRQKNQLGWGTVKNYVVRLGKLVECAHMNRMFKEEPRWHSDFKLLYANALSTCGKIITQEANEGAKDLAKRLLTVSQFKEYFDSRWRRDLLDVYAMTTSVRDTAEAYREMRNFLALDLLMKKGKRAGVLADLTVADVDDMTAANPPEQDGLLTVALHKTSKVYGPAHFIIEPRVRRVLTRMLASSAKKTRKDEAMAQCDHGDLMVFRSKKTGLSITSADINR